MDAKVTWQQGLSFVGVTRNGFPVRMDSNPGPESGVSPMEMIGLSLAGCTAMDVISILEKKREVITDFEVSVHAERARDFPRVFVGAVIEYAVTGQHVDEHAVLRAIELSVTKYCPVEAMLSKAFPMEFRYQIYEGRGAARELVKGGVYP